MNDRFELVLLNRAEEVARLQDELEQFAARHEFSKRALHDVQIALEEHLTNVVRYGYADELEHGINVRLMFQSPELQIEVEDDGRPFNPLEHPVPNLAVPIEDRPIGGLGIHMMRKVMDRIEYRRVDGKNLLRLTKRVKTPAP